MDYADSLRELTTQNHIEEFVPGMVYENLIKVMEYRGGKLLYPKLELTLVAQKLNAAQYVSIIGERSAEDIRGATMIILILLSPGSKYVSKTTNMKKLLKDMMPKSELPLEIMIVSAETINIYVRKAIREQELRVDIATYAIFKTNPFDHVSVGKYTFLNKVELRKFTERYHESSNNFSIILTSDPISLWLGIHAGHVVKVIGASESAGLSMEYRKCVRGGKLVDKYKKDDEDEETLETED